jgi:RNA polymerase sigma factor (sigma-70 family)
MSGEEKQKDLRQEERLLLDRLAKGDPDAFDLIYRKYFDAVHRNACMLLKDASEAEDVVQETFLSFWRSRQSMEGRESAGGWLFITCYNRCMNILKRRLRESMFIQEISRNKEDSHNSSALEERRSSLLEIGMARLSVRQNEAFTLCKLQGKSYEEAAYIMGVSRHTVKEYLAHAMKVIRRFAKENAWRMTILQCFLQA